MCGIVGCITKESTLEFLIDGLKELEYRGYDSAGLVILEANNSHIYKAIGKIVNLENKVGDFKTSGFSVGIAHTRWATHGKPTEINAHPHSGEISYIVHNGIIENYADIKKELGEEKFVSQTDTETIVHLFEHNLSIYENSLKAFEATIEALEGAYAILLITKSQNDTIYFAKKGSPLILGYSDNKDLFFASSESPLIGKAKEVSYLEDGDYGYISPKTVKIYNQKESKTLSKTKLPSNKQFAQKDGFRFFMEKELYEQSLVSSDTMIGRVKDDYIAFDEIDIALLEGIKEIKICACGTSYHAGLVASYLLQRVAKIRCSVEIASEFRYKEPLLSKDMLFVTISQSGETADTIEALKIAKLAGLKSLCICNVDNSTLIRLSDTSILTRAGIEKGVASTKAFTTQVIVLWMLSLYLAKHKNNISTDELKKHIKALLHTPRVLKVKSTTHEKLTRLSKRYLHGHGFFFIGRDIFYPLALEGALKLKELSYIHAEGYPSGEMKHGPIALADSELFTVALMSKNILYDKIKSNLEELIARDATTLAISPYKFDLSDDFIQIEEHDHEMLEFFEMLVIVQLFSMEIAVRLGNDVDMPRNLAKSVTVE
ncbi:MAG: Glucosamine--fructose-6-phosphate aminotransferase [isomerizing] (EC [uncultured Campylobacterales bacterium]|uniref:Glutamine--fructose-6-phosphate aminotransferase [isomerizing] n=1 Tax=uncultured Campylobacterales bacterium TaxID=352960 RepID=A0A6S6SJB5_9BACT|nr:MAG: Glucosamine--fructose-6-phosphate aminotransferase [isomerizing] (EC [uncultured Campylobacterales bacterium]